VPTARRTLPRGAAARTSVRLGAGLALALASAALAAPAAAQDPRIVTPSGSPCSYDSCVLRVEDTWFSRRLVRGPEGTVVARLGFGGPSLASVVQLSDSAVHHARLYQRAQTTGTVITTLGTLASLASWVIYANADRDEDLRQEVTAINVGALVAGIVGTTFHLKARRELSRSVWWYNRAVTGVR
jgi:hypothetical protein